MAKMSSTQPRRPPARAATDATRSQLWLRPWVVALAIAAVALLMLRFYAGSTAAPVATWFLVVNSVLLAVWLAAATGYGAAILVLVSSRSATRADAAAGEDGRVVWGVTAAALGMGVLSLLTLLSGLLGVLNQISAAGLIAFGILAGAVTLTRYFRMAASSVATGEPLQAAPTRAGWRWAWLLVAPFVGIAVTAALLPPGLLWNPEEPHAYDVVEYHLQVPREWYEAGRITPLHHNVFSFFPFNVEMHYLLGMHLAGGPWRAMHLAQFMHLSMIAMTVAAVSGFAARKVTGQGRFSVPPAILAGLATATVPWLVQLGAIAYVEGGLLLYGTLAAGWTMLALADPTRRLRFFALAGVMAGFACGCKLTAVPMVLLAVPAVAFVVLASSRRRAAGAREPLRSLMMGPAGFVVAGLLTFSPWLVRNAVWAGNPLFPEAMTLLGHGHFSPTQVTRWQLAYVPPPEQRSVVGRLHALGDQVLWNWKFGYVLLPLSAVAWVSTRRDPSAWLLAGLVALLGVVWLGFTHLQGRFFVLATPWCALLLARVDWGQLGWMVLAIVAAAAVPGWMRINSRIDARLGSDRSYADALGRENIDWIMADTLERFPTEDEHATLILAGDAKAFFYTLPMARLRYRTIFDADTDNGRSAAEAWGAASPDNNAWVLVDPAEVARLGRTYPPFPTLPAEWMREPEWETGRPFLIPPKPMGSRVGNATP